MIASRHNAAVACGVRVFLSSRKVAGRRRQSSRTSASLLCSETIALSAGTSSSASAPVIFTSWIPALRSRSPSGPNHVNMSSRLESRSRMCPLARPTLIPGSPSRRGGEAQWRRRRRQAGGAPAAWRRGVRRRRRASCRRWACCVRSAARRRRRHRGGVARRRRTSPSCAFSCSRRTEARASASTRFAVTHSTSAAARSPSTRWPSAPSGCWKVCVRRYDFGVASGETLWPAAAVVPVLPLRPSRRGREHLRELRRLTRQTSRSDSTDLHRSFQSLPSRYASRACSSTCRWSMSSWCAAMTCSVAGAADASSRRATRFLRRRVSA